MSALSERAYFAGWMDGLELALWKALDGGPLRYGRVELTLEELQHLRDLSERCGGWIRFDPSEEEVFIPLGTWLQIVANSHEARR
jgi:hypothetical protein